MRFVVLEWSEGKYAALLLVWITVPDIAPFVCLYLNSHTTSVGEFPDYFPSICMCATNRVHRQTALLTTNFPLTHWLGQTINRLLCCFPCVSLCLSVRSVEISSLCTGNSFYYRFNWPANHIIYQFNTFREVQSVGLPVWKFVRSECNVVSI